MCTVPAATRMCALVFLPGCYLQFSTNDGINTHSNDASCNVKATKYLCATSDYDK